jgi:hypothetical protein
MNPPYVLMRSDGSCLRTGSATVFFKSFDEALQRLETANSWCPRNPYFIIGSLAPSDWQFELVTAEIRR